MSAPGAGVPGVGVDRLGCLIASTVPPRFEENTPLLASIGWWGSETSCHWCQTPLFDIRFYKHKSTLPKVDVNGTRSVGADGGEEILGFEAVRDVVQLFTIAGEEDGASSRAVADADDVALHILGAVFCGVKGLVEAAVAGGRIGYRGFVPAYIVISTDLSGS